jgi:hypothetical protein
MNKNLLLAIIAVTLIPAFFNIGKGITGMAVNDTTTQVAQSSGHFASGAILVYFIVSVVLLSIVISYLIALHNAGQKLRTAPKKGRVKHFEKMKSTWSNVKGFQFSKIDDDKAAQYIVAIVAIVGLVAILIMIL